MVLAAPLSRPDDIIPCVTMGGDGGVNETTTRVDMPMRVFEPPLPT
jgi:hypothetical protein